MTTKMIRDLVILSVTRPADAARQILAYPVPREALWTALFLAAVLNTLFYQLSRFLMPGPSPFPGALEAPGIYLGLVAAGLIITIYAIYRAGRMMGGQGSLDDVMKLMIWLQFLRVIAQIATLVLAFTIPMLAALMVLAATIVGLYIMVNFIDQAHRFGSLGKAIGVLILSGFALAFFVSILLTFAGGVFLEIPSDV
ncbi:Yip1 family protein [Phaeobacter marinintestinus]|uniref:Yip1 family protein n=1 Tax=Falsiphaeobacter marinintestinus TaxID=1492905 RepID=UPI0011B707D8|nr:Yip1 family protein [Phaeobacter marinintestinus]